MYAKLVFPGGTENTQIARDITRAIVNSTGAGGSTVGALEFADAGLSTIDDTVAAGWTLAGGESIPSGASVDQDKRFHLQQAHANTSTKTVALGVHTFNPSDGLTTANNASGYNAVRLTPVLDYGQSYVAYPFHPAQTQTASTTMTPWFGVSASLGQCTVHVIAKDKVLMIAGDKKGYDANRNFQLVMESNDTYETREGRNRPGQVWVAGAMSYGRGYSTSSLSTKPTVVDFTSTNLAGSAYPNSLMMMFCDALYSYQSDAEIRVGGVFKDSWISTGSTPSSADPGNQAGSWYIERDTGQADGYATAYNYDTVGSPAPESWFFPAQSSNWAYGYHALCIDPTSHIHDTGFSARGLKDNTGNPMSLLKPMICQVGDSGHLTDFTTGAGMYLCSNTLGTEYRIINDGTDDYLTLPVSDTAGNSGAFSIKVN